MWIGKQHFRKLLTEADTAPRRPAPRPAPRPAGYARQARPTGQVRPTRQARPIQQARQSTSIRSLRGFGRKQSPRTLDKPQDPKKVIVFIAAVVLGLFFLARENQPELEVVEVENV